MVARETSVLEALRRFGAPEAASPKLLELHDLLIEVAIPRGFVGTAERETMLDRHILQSAALYPLASGPIVDVGSGAGLPGLVLACLVPGSVTLVESHARRVAFLREAVAQLDLDVDVVQARAEDAAHAGLRERFLCGVARALAPPAVTAELVLPLVRPGGRMIVLVGRTAAESDAAHACQLLGGGSPVIRELEVPGSTLSARAMIVDKIGVTPPRYPRRSGVPARRPLVGE